MQLDLSLPPSVVRVLDALSAHGAEAWLVGGVVRDGLRGVSTRDFDLATSLAPDALQGIFPDAKLEFGGLSFAVDDLDFTVTTLRADGVYSDARHPDEIRVVETPTEDARRRDFTVNAIYWEPRSGQVVDPTGGVEDLRAGIVRTIGDPAIRLREDPLRILRALRFAGRIEGALEAETAAVICSHPEWTETLSRERVGAELERGFSGSAGGAVLRLLGASGIAAGVGAAVLPEIAARDAAGTELAASLLELVPRRRALVWAAVCDGLVPAAAAALMERLRLPTRDREAVAALLAGETTYRELFALPPRARDAWLRGAGVEDQLALQAGRLETLSGEVDRGDPARKGAAPGDHPPSAAHLEAVREALRDLPKEPLDALCRGADVLAAGVPTGPQVGEVLAAVRAEIDRQSVSDRDAALAILASIVESRFRSPGN